MPEVVSRLDSGLPEFPAAAGRGDIYRPLPQDTQNGTMRAHAVQTIRADAQDLYSLWRKFELAPRWMEFVVSTEKKSDTVTHWVVGDPDDPKGKRIEYDSEITAAEPGKRIAWKSLDTSIDESGEVLFEPAPGDRGTTVTLRESAHVPGGKLGVAAAAVAKRSPRQIVIEDLRHFKQLAETGEIPTVAKNPHGPRGIIGSFKERMYGEANPTPPGTSDFAKEQD
jgi:uncharacterized membrane protein